MSRFDFLKDEFQPLYDRCIQAEQAADVSVKMLKIRQTLEYLVRELGEDGNDLFNNIGSLSDRDILDENISKLFQRTRMITNRGIHENQEDSVTPDEGRTAMDNLAEIAVWYAVEYREESFALKDFAAEDVIRAKRYLDTGVDTVENKTRHTVRDMVNVDPLAVAGGFDDDDDAPADPLEQDVFETDEEYAERIVQMEPIHIGYAILDMRKSDGYTNVRFLQHHLDKNRRVRFTQSPVCFFVDQAEQDLVIDGELVAKLRVHENDVYCDYSRIFLRSDEEDIPVRVICWDKIGYESEEDHQKRIEALPILPLALCKPIRKQYDIERQILPFAIQKFAYVHIPMEDIYSIPCNRDLAKQVTAQKEIFTMFGKIQLVGGTEDFIIWNKGNGVLYGTANMLKTKKQEKWQASNIEVKKALERIKYKQVEQERQLREQREREEQERKLCEQRDREQEILNAYIQHKSLIKEELEELIVIAQERRLYQISAELIATKCQLESERFRIVIVGEFSRGKSTLINAMLGRLLLPASKQTTTRVISKIVYGEKPLYTLHYRDGKQKNINEEEFLCIRAEAEYQEWLGLHAKTNISGMSHKIVSFDNIEYAEIMYPSDFCRNQIEIIDTPGTNDLNVGRMEINFNYVYQADAIILVLSAIQALTQSELDFLKEQLIGNHIEDIFIVINYKDALDNAAQEEEVLQHVGSNIYQHTGRKPRIFLVSSRQALLYRRQQNGEQLKRLQLKDIPKDMDETGILSLEDAVRCHVLKQKGQKKLREYEIKIQKYKQEIQR